MPRRDEREVEERKDSGKMKAKKERNIWKKWE